MVNQPKSTSEALKNYISGKWVSASQGATFDDENPARKGSVLARFQSSSPQDMTSAVDAATESFRHWRRTSVEERQQHGARFIHLLREMQDELASIVTRENGKTLREARAEVQSALVEGTHHVYQTSTFYGHTLPTGTIGQTGWVQYHPLGVVGIISPWNFPVNVMCRKALPALMTGNTVVFKPATFTPWSAVFMAQLFAEAGFAPGAFNCVTGLGSAVGNALVEDPRVRAISFTGSTDVGKRIHQRAAKNLTRTQLELGGKNALIIMDDADLPAALEAALTAGFACAGQWCTSTSRILIQKKVHARFIDMLVARCEQMVVGDPLDEGTSMGPVAGPDQFRNILEAIDRAKSEGARMVAGGAATGKLGETGYFIRPTVFADVQPEMSVFRDEIFGPVLALSTFDSLEEALRLANDSCYALSSGIFTKDIVAAQKYIAEIEAGLAHVNSHTGFKHPALPFGGWKESGFGLPENSKSGLEFFVNRKAVYIKQG
ncbi:MAG TPA: aldehyde dehydrogenase family protein [Terriglobia bacterium]|nr:aldehyde dehydrogenase family protein [Terriglobia bacterium]